jgi:hypothetical protein
VASRPVSTTGPGGRDVARTGFAGTFGRGLIRALIAVLASLAAALGCSAGAEGPPAVEPPRGEARLPDLAFAPLADLKVGVSPDGRRLLYFTASIVNLGDGPLLLAARRERGDWRVQQRVTFSEGGTEQHAVAAALVFGGDGHDHWHLVQAARYRLTALDNPQAVDLHDAKAGFCFFDQVPFRTALPGAPDGPQHSTHDCGEQRAKSLTMGLSVGWADPYQWFLPRQNIDVTRLPEGRYRLEATVDPEGWLIERDRENNRAWVEFRLSVRQEDGLPVVEILSASESV